MKSIWIGVFGLLVLVFAGTFALAVYATLHDENKVEPDVAARQAECRKLALHLIEISPERDGRGSIDELVGKVPVEDIEQCGAVYPEVVECMEKAADMTGVRTCIPKAVECKEDAKETVVEANPATGARPTYEVSGACDVVTIKASNAFVAVKVPKRVDIVGNANRVHIFTGKDKVHAPVNDTGTTNSVRFTEPKE